MQTNLFDPDLPPTAPAANPAPAPAPAANLPALPPTLTCDRPVVFFDVEATGLNKQSDRIISIALLRYEPSGAATSHSWLVNPQMHISEESTAIHGITDADVAAAPTFSALLPDLDRVFDGADIAGYNVAGFDIPILQAEYARAGARFSLDSRRVIDVQKIFFRKEPRDLSAALRFYCGQSLDNAHDAMADIRATVSVLAGQYRRYAADPDFAPLTTSAALAAYCEQRKPEWVDRTGKFRWFDGQVVFNFGKFQNKPLREAIQREPGLIAWFMKGDFPQDAKDLVRRARDQGIYPRPPTA